MNRWLCYQVRYLVSVAKKRALPGVHIPWGRISPPTPTHTVIYIYSVSHVFRSTCPFYRGKPACRAPGPYFLLCKMAFGCLMPATCGRVGRLDQLGARLCHYAATFGQDCGRVGASAEATRTRVWPTCAKLAPQKRYKLVRAAPHGLQPHG